MTLTRRQFIAAVAAAAMVGCTDDDDGEAGPASTDPTTATTTATTGGVVAPEPPPVALSGDPFTLGVASGDPTPDAVILWTRLLPAEGLSPGDVPLVWEVARDADFATLAAAGLVVAAADDALCVHVDATGLDAATPYYFRFRAGNFVSRRGPDQNGTGSRRGG